MDETNKDRTAQQITGGKGDNNKGKKLQFQSGKTFSFEEDISLKPPGYCPQTYKKVKSIQSNRY